MPSTSEGSPTTAAHSAPGADAETTDQPPSPGLFDRLRMMFRRGSVSSIREDLRDALSAEAPFGENPDFSPAERAMLRNVLGLRGLRVDDVMVPRADITAVPASVTLGDLLALFRSAEHSRLPVYGETLDEPLGIVHIKDVLAQIMGRASVGSRNRKTTQSLDLGRVDLTQPLSGLKILRPVLYIPPSMPALDLFAQMQATRIHLALVIDEYGGTDGLVTIEDLIEMVVGDIEDEHDDDTTSMIRANTDGTFDADARVALKDVTEMVGTDLEQIDAADDVDTLGGLLVTMAGRVPVRGEILPGPGDLEFEVLDADPRRLKRVRIARRLDKGLRERKEATGRRREASAVSPEPSQPIPGQGGQAGS